MIRTRRRRATSATTLDVGRARDLLAANQSRLLWPAGLTFAETAALGGRGNHCRCGCCWPVARLRWRCWVISWRQCGCWRSAGTASWRRRRSCRRARPGCGLPVPDTPLCYILHGNAPTVWCRQSEKDPNQHVMTRIPAMRIRTVNALLGYDEPLYLPASAKLSFGK